MEPFKVITRDEWYAKEPKKIQSLAIPALYVFTIFTNKQHCYSLRDCVTQLHYLQDRHMNTKLRAPDICYNFLISNEGQAYEGRGWTNEPTLPMRFKHIERRSLFIAFMGSYRNGAPDEKSLNAKMNLIKFGLENRLISPHHVEVFFNANVFNLLPMTYHELRVLKRVPHK